MQRIVRRFIKIALLGIAVATLLLVSLARAHADPEYLTVELKIDVNASAQETWNKVGNYCDIAAWGDFPCEITSGDGGPGTIRSLGGGNLLEVLIRKTDLSYGYTVPKESQNFYNFHNNFYFAFLEAKPISDSTCQLIYTLLYDISNMGSQENKDQNLKQRKALFNNFLKNMKAIAEAD